MTKQDEVLLHQMMTLAPKDVFLVEECEFPSVVHIPKKAYEHKETIKLKCQELRAFSHMTEAQI